MWSGIPKRTGLYPVRRAGRGRSGEEIPAEIKGGFILATIAIGSAQQYEDLLKETNDKNGVFTAEFEYIKETYRQRQEQNDFLA